MARGEMKTDFLYRDDAAFVIRDIHPRAPVHLLVIPMRHFIYQTDMAQAAEPLVGHLFAVAREVARREGLDKGGYRMAINQGDNAGQTIAHLHLHLLGGRRLGPEG
jgi:histidine triad (HIT) family protein